MAQHQHYLNIFEVLRRVTTSVESWEEIESYEEQVGERRQPLEPGHAVIVDEVTPSHRLSGIPRLELERPDVMGEHPVTDTEDNEGKTCVILRFINAVLAA